MPINGEFSGFKSYKPRIESGQWLFCSLLRRNYEKNDYENQNLGISDTYKAEIQGFVYITSYAKFFIMPLVS